MSRLARISVVTLSVVVFLYVGLGYVLGKTNDDKSYRSLSVFGEVLQHIQEDYVDEPNMAVVTAGALHGLLESLDPQSGYLSPREYADYRDRMKNAQHGEAGNDDLQAIRLHRGRFGGARWPGGEGQPAQWRNSGSHRRIQLARHVGGPGQHAFAGRSRHDREGGCGAPRKNRAAGNQHQPRRDWARSISWRIASPTILRTCACRRSIRWM